MLGGELSSDSIRRLLHVASPLGLEVPAMWEAVVTNAMAPITNDIASGVVVLDGEYAACWWLVLPGALRALFWLAFADDCSDDILERKMIVIPCAQIS